MTGIALEQLSSQPRADGFAVTGVDLQVAEGTVCVLIGPSGSGKTTLLRLVAGVEAVASGTVRIGEDDVTAWSPGERDLAWFDNEHPLYPHLDVEHNIGFALRLRRRLRRTDLDERVRAEARAAGIHPLLPRMPSTLSAGEQQAAGLARTTARLPRAYLLDEPLARIDTQQRARLRAELRMFLESLQVPALLATNDQHDALTLADQLAVLRDGRLVQSGPSRELLERPAEAFVAAFLHPAHMNILAGRVELGRRSTWVRIGDAAAVPLEGVPQSLRSTLDERPVHLGLGADDLHVVEETDQPGAFRVVVERVEPLGHATLVRGRVMGARQMRGRSGGHAAARGREQAAARRGQCSVAIVVQVDPALHVDRGATLTVAADGRYAHLFDPITGRALWHAVDEP